MRQLLLIFSSLLALIAITVDHVYGCTIFKVTGTGVTLVGNNEDWSDPDSKVWFFTPEKGKYGRVYFGFKDCRAQGGMNDQGLFYDWVARDKCDWKPDPHKDYFTGSLAEKILEESATVEQALNLYKRYNESSFANAKTMLVDKTGASAIVVWENGKLNIVRSRNGFQGIGRGYPVANEKLSKLERASVESVSSILDACVYGGEFPTRYSNVYDLQRGEVYVFLFRDQIPPVKLNLQEELHKGNHYYDIPYLTDQINQPPMIDSKTLRVAQVDPAIYFDYAGKYQLAPDTVFTISTQNSRIYIKIFDEPLYELFPASSTKFFLPFVDSHVIFRLDNKGYVYEAFVHTPRMEKLAKRIK